VRVIGRLLRGAKSFVKESVLSEHKGELFRNRTRSAKRLAHKISKMALRRSQEAKADLRAAYERLLEVGKATLKQAGRVRDLLGESPSARKVADEISRFSELLEWAVLGRPGAGCSKGSALRRRRSCSPSSRSTRS
jgi:hypothetical protein